MIDTVCVEYDFVVGKKKQKSDLKREKRSRINNTSFRNRYSGWLDRPIRKNGLPIWPKLDMAQQQFAVVISVKQSKSTRVLIQTVTEATTAAAHRRRGLSGDYSNNSII